MPKLTKTVVDGLKPSTSDVWCWDLELPGFGVRVQPSGRKTYGIRYRNAASEQRKMTLCRCADMPPDRARDLARKKFADVAEGKDPAAERRPAKEASGATVEALFKGYVASMRAKGRASADEVERALLLAKENAADALGRARPAAEVQPLDIVRYVAIFFKRGHRGAADKHRSYISSAYAWAIASTNDYTVEHRLDWGITRNPAADVAKDPGATKTVDRNLVAADLRTLWDATLAQGGGFAEDTGACIRTIIACGQRVQETLRLDGADIDLEARIWEMPAHKTKGKKRPHTIPLPEVIIPTLEAQIAKHGDGLLFPGSEGEIMDHRSINHALDRWLDRDDVELDGFTPRDLRRTWKSRAHDAGVDRFTRDLIQQHAKSDTGSKHYDRSDYVPQMRDGMAKWSSWLGIVLAGGTPAAPGEPRLKLA